jgi:hypothetical protein
LSGALTLTIGSGGAAVAASADGNIGGNTTFGSALTAYGGKGGRPGTNAYASLNIQPTNTSSLNPIDFVFYDHGLGGRADDDISRNFGGYTIYGGGGGGGIGGAQTTSNGGTSIFGGNGGGGRRNTNGVAGTAPAGGGGAANGSYNSGAGAAGRIRVRGL